jgi:hypothetical protein
MHSRDLNTDTDLHGINNQTKAHMFYSWRDNKDHRKHGIQVEWFKRCIPEASTPDAAEFATTS